jgi:hypothetical protein
MGVEPTSPAWKAGVIAVIRQPRDIGDIFSKIGGFVKVLFFGSLVCDQGKNPEFAESCREIAGGGVAVAGIY